MKILGVDPGTARLGWGIIDEEKASQRVLAYGVIETSPKLSDARRLVKIEDELKQIILHYQPDRLAVEKLFYFKNQKTIITVSQARGVILALAGRSELPIFEYTPLQVKQAIACYGRADKQQMQKMVQLHLNLKELPQPDDAADALAVAITCANSNRF